MTPGVLPSIVSVRKRAIMSPLPVRLWILCCMALGMHMLRFRCQFIVFRVIATKGTKVTELCDAVPTREHLYLLKLMIARMFVLSRGKAGGIAVAFNIVLDFDFTPIPCLRRGRL